MQQYLNEFNMGTAVIYWGRHNKVQALSVLMMHDALGQPRDIYISTYLSFEPNLGLVSSTSHGEPDHSNVKLFRYSV